MANLDGANKGNLQGEIATNHFSGEWYFIKEERSDAEESGDSLFGIVSKRDWHLHHAFKNYCVSDEVSLPAGFREYNESVFSYKGSTHNAELLLQQHGFQKLENPYWWSDALTVYVPIYGGWPRLSLTSDTPEIKSKLENWIATEFPVRSEHLPSDWSREVYTAKLQRFADLNDLELFITDDYGVDQYWMGVSGSFVPKDIASKLPIPNQS